MSKQVVTPVRLTRVLRGLRQVEVAQRAGIAQPRLSRIECGWVEPRADELRALAQAMRVPQRELAAVGGAA